MLPSLHQHPKLRSPSHHFSRGSQDRGSSNTIYDRRCIFHAGAFAYPVVEVFDPFEGVRPLQPELVEFGAHPGVDAMGEVSRTRPWSSCEHQTGKEKGYDPAEHHSCKHPGCFHANCAFEVQGDSPCFFRRGGRSREGGDLIEGCD